VEPDVIVRPLKDRDASNHRYAQAMRETDAAWTDPDMDDEPPDRR